VTRSVISAEASVTRDIDQISSSAGTRVTRDCQIDRNTTVVYNEDSKSVMMSRNPTRPPGQVCILALD
jgi:hypothetical protein